MLDFVPHAWRTALALVLASDATTSPPLGSLSGVNSFPLERPALRLRRRGTDPHASATALPYFLAGDENRLAAFVCQADAAIFEFGNPLLFIGPTGAGKTALALHTASREATAMGDAHGPATVQYLPAVDFARQYAEAVDADDMPPFRSQIDEAPVLVIDDLNLISDKPAAQDELASRVELRTQAGRPTVLTCRLLPSEIRGMRPMLVSRTLPGLTVPISAPGDETRRLLLRELAVVHAGIQTHSAGPTHSAGQGHSLEIGHDLLDLLAAGLPPDLSCRVLESAVKQIGLWCRMHESSPCVAAVQAALDSVGRGTDVSLSAITSAVARHFRLRSSELKSSSRRQAIVRARSLAMLLVRRHTTKSLHQIGDHFGGRDHTTVLHAIRKTESLLATDADLRRALDEVSEKLSR